MPKEELSRRDFIKTTVLGLAAMIRTDNLTETSEAISQIENKFINKDGNCEFTFTSPNQSEAHNSANVFAREIGNALKSGYPSKVLDPKVHLQVFIRGGQKLYSLTWTAKIVKASVAEANWVFDRRGTLLSGQTLAEAKSRVEAQLEKSKKVSELRHFKSANIPKSFIQDSFARSGEQEYWYIKEFFMVAPIQ
jgi:hypothetical protein